MRAKSPRARLCGEFSLKFAQIPRTFLPNSGNNQGAIAVCFLKRKKRKCGVAFAASSDKGRLIFGAHEASGIAQIASEIAGEISLMLRLGGRNSVGVLAFFGARY
jgi:hypothetical protein